MNPEIVIALSGGLDSATLLHSYLSNGLSVFPVWFSYGSKHNAYECQSHSNLMRYFLKQFPERLHDGLCIDLQKPMRTFQSSLMANSSEDIPEGHYQEESMRSTVVPGRNLIFASFLAGIAESIKASTIALGVHSGDHHIYPDCRPEFIHALAETIKASTNGSVLVETPYLNYTKADIVAIGIALETPYEFTRTCYKAQRYACGKCGACTERLEAFALNNCKDPIKYE